MPKLKLLIILNIHATGRFLVETIFWLEVLCLAKIGFKFLSLMPCILILEIIALISIMSFSTINIAVFASGTGTNARNMMNYFRESSIKIALVVCNKPGAGVISVAEDHAVPVLMIQRDSFYTDESCLHQLRDYGIDWLVLAGFLWKIPSNLVKAFPGKIINIHPALLPKYGGKGMYGHHVHEAVIKAKETESGISIHFVDEVYDNGEMIVQAKCSIEEGDTAVTLAAKIQELEQALFPPAIEKVIKAKA